MIEVWKEAWPKALALWSNFVMLREPRLCNSNVEAAKENLTTSFAMIRFADQQVVVNLEGVEHYKLQDYALEILAHEIGHHIFCPANITDHAKMIAKIRRALPMCEKESPLVANLYADLMINDRLQRSAGLHMDAIYKALRTENQPDMWNLYMRIYEILWSLPRNTLTSGELRGAIEADAVLGSRLIRAYAHDPILGVSSFTSLLYPYIAANKAEEGKKIFKPLYDMEDPMEGSEIPSGLTEDDDDAESDPSKDPAITGKPGRSDGKNPVKMDKIPRGIVEYGEILKLMGSKLTDKQIVAAYYRELSKRYLVPFPEKISTQSKELQAEGLEIWDIGTSMEEVDWFQSAAMSPVLIPGVTIVERHYSEVPGAEPEKIPLDLYIGIDCSGSMGNPAFGLSYPVLAGTIMARSALRSGATVMACLSGESNGETISTEKFVRNENTILNLITDYLGTGYSFGIHYLKEHIIQRKNPRPLHMIIVSDQDIFTILDEDSLGAGTGWKVAAAAIKSAKGGGTMILNIPPKPYEAKIARLEKIGWTVFTVSSMEEIVGFARDFSRQVYAKMGGRH